MFSEMTVKLIPKPESIATLLVTFENVRTPPPRRRRLPPPVAPACIELMDGATLDALRQAGNAVDARAGASCSSELDVTAPEAEAAHSASRTCERAGHRSPDRARPRAARPALGRATRHEPRREEALETEAGAGRGRTAARVVEELDRVRASERRAWLSTYGHVGDGTLHVVFSGTGTTGGAELSKRSSPAPQHAGARGEPERRARDRRAPSALPPIGSIGAAHRAAARSEAQLRSSRAPQPRQFLPDRLVPRRPGFDRLKLAGY